MQRLGVIIDLPVDELGMAGDATFCHSGQRLFAIGYRATCRANFDPMGSTRVLITATRSRHALKMNTVVKYAKIANDL
jgi:hypothetical protein